MERRLKLLEKLKLTKLNKLTVKQGGVDVKLNLKKDLSDPNVAIEDKVLDMLEQYVSTSTGSSSAVSDGKKLTDDEMSPLKHQQQKLQSKSHAEQENVRSNTSDNNKKTDQTVVDASLSPSPTKRVRFDVANLSHDLNNKQIRVGETENQVNNKQVSEVAIDGVEVNDENERTRAPKEFICRLCKMKLSSERSLYEHVARLHGGKGSSLNQQFISKLRPPSSTTTTSQSSRHHRNDIDDDDDNENDDEDGDENENENSDFDVDNDDDDQYDENVSAAVTAATAAAVTAAVADEDADENAMVIEENTNSARSSEIDLDESQDDIDSAVLGAKKFTNLADRHRKRSVSSSSSLSTSIQKRNSGGKIFPKTTQQTYPSSAAARASSAVPTPPRPNVAIRVAKVAYYNSKANVAATTTTTTASTSNANPFKSSIFSNGGMRGNFFSQERLPLRSCKIKMKLANLPTTATKKTTTNDGIDDDEETSSSERFLVSTNQLVRLEPIDKNRILSVQSAYCENPHDQLITNKEIRQFFKSLLTYIPSSNPSRLDDLFIKHEAYLSRLSQSFSLNNDVNQCLRVIHAVVLDAKQFGITLFDLRRKVNEKLLQQQHHHQQRALKLNELRSLVEFLVDNFLVLVVGVVEPIYVCHEFKQPWVIQSYKSLKGRSSFDDSAFDDKMDEDELNTNEMEIESEKVALESTTADNNIETLENKRPKRIIKPPPRLDPSTEPYTIKKITTTVSTATTTSSTVESDAANVVASTSELTAAADGTNAPTTTAAATAKNFKPVCLIPRPWRYIDGLLNRPVLKQMLESILIYLKVAPHATAQTICEHYCPSLQPVVTRELLDMLERIKCVRKSVLRRELVCDLFSDFTNGSDEIVDADQLVGNEVYVYHLNQNSMFTFKKVFPN